MYKYRDTKRDIPNTFDPLSENKDFCIAEIIFMIDRGFLRRNILPTDVLKRVDAELKFIDETQVKKTKPLPA